MKLNEILQLDLREAGNKEIVREALVRLPFFKDKECEDYISVEDLENAIWKMSKKYPIGISYIMTGKPGESYYSLMIRRHDSYQMLKTVYGQTIWEGLAKASLFMYGYIKNVIQKEE